MKLIAAAVALLLWAQDEKVEIKWKFQKGQEHRFRHTQKSQTDAGVMKMEQSQTMTTSHSVTDVDEKGVATLRVKYEAIALKSTGFQETEYDSEKDKEPPDDPQAKMMSRLVGKTFTLKMTPTGRVVDVKGFDKILEEMLKDTDDGDPQGAILKQVMKQMFSDEGMKSMMQQMYAPLPDGPVAVGHAWPSELGMQVPMLGKAKLLMKSRVAAIKDRSAHLDHDMKMEFKADDDGNNPLAGLIEVKESKGLFTTVFSIERGVLISYKGEMKMTMAAAGQEMTMKSQQEMQLVEKKAGKEY